MLPHEPDALAVERGLGRLPVLVVVATKERGVEDAERVALRDERLVAGDASRRWGPPRGWTSSARLGGASFLHAPASDPDGDEGNGRDAHMVSYVRVIITVATSEG